MEAFFRAGAAYRPITPPLGGWPVFLAGFSRDRRASEIGDDLYARALALEWGGTTVVLVICDLIDLPRSDVVQLRQALAAEAAGRDATLIVACTHTHSGPDTLGLWGPNEATSGVDHDYMAHVHQEVVAAALAALADLHPAQLCCGSCRFPGWIKNLRTPDVIDDELTVVRFETLEGATIATLLNLACHPEVLPDESHRVSADFAGAACRALEAQCGGVALFAPAALGGMLSPAVEPRTSERAQAMGEALATAALAALGPATAIQLHGITMRRAPLRLPLENPLFAAALASGLLRGTLAGGDPPTIETDLTYLDLGPAQLLTIPGELLPRLGFALKEAMPGPCRLLIGLADDELGYILPDDEFIRPHDYTNPGAQYEESMSLGPHTGSLLVAAALGVIG